MMKVIRFASLMLLAVIWCQQQAHAVGTAANATITNTATASYSIAGNPGTASDAVSFNVDEILETTIANNSGGNVIVNTPDTNRVLTFLVTNTGNGTEPFKLTLTDSGADQFNPSNQRIYLDTDGAIGLNTTTDTLYTPGASADITLNANNTAGYAGAGTWSALGDSYDRLTVYVVSDIPASLNNNDLGTINLKTESTTAGASGVAAGTVLATLGDGGVDAVVGNSNADADVDGSYVVNAVTVTVNKTVPTVTDPWGGNEYVPGATLTYQIDVTVAGTGTVTALTITDPIPANTTYVNGTITVDGTPDDDDTAAGGGAGGGGADIADYNVTNATTVTVNLGDVTVAGGSTSTTIQFNVTID